MYLIGSLFIKFVQGFPLTWVARMGRAGGALAYRLDKRHRAVATGNLTAALGKEHTAEEIESIAREHFKRLGENYACAIKTAGMTDEQLKPHLEIANVEAVNERENPSVGIISAIGHFGNFELYARTDIAFPGAQCAATYRALKPEWVDRLIRKLRDQSGCLFFERRTEVAGLKKALSERNIFLGLLCDQSSGRHGLRLPFFGRECSTNTSPAVFALRYELPLYTTICYRVGLAQWKIKFGEQIPTVVDGEKRSIEAIMTDVNAALEEAVRRDPANWFWVHKRWK